jgi:hypothetical protein
MDISANGAARTDGEPEIAVNPVSPRNLLIDWTDFPYPYSPLGPAESCDAKVSDDGGLSWQPVSLPANSVTAYGCGDAVAAAGPDGTLYSGGGDPTFVGLGGPVGGVFTIHGEDVVSRSADGGHTWSPAIETMGSDNNRFAPGATPDDPFDRPWLAVDQSTGTVYASGANIVDHERFVTASANEARSFGTIYPVDSPAYPQAASIFSGSIAASKGVLAVAYTASSAPGATCPCVIFETSTDHGAAFARHVVPLVGAATSPSPFIAADPARHGRFALAVLDAAGTQLQVYATGDSGSTWRGPVSVGEAPANQRFKPWISYGPSGQIALMWKTSYRDGSYDVWAAVGRQEGRSGLVFTPPMRVSSAAAPYPPLYVARDDFSWVIADRRYIHVGWGDSRAGAVHAWYARIPLAAFNGAHD